MSKILTIRNKLLSLRGQMDINDEHDQSLFTAKGELSFIFSPTWRIFDSQNKLATIKKKKLTFRPTYSVRSIFGSYTVKRKLLSWTRQYYVVDGMYQGATANGSLLDLAFTISHGDREISSASEKLISLRDTHVIVVNEDEEPDVLFTTVMMVIMQLDKKNDSVAVSD